MDICNLLQTQQEGKAETVTTQVTSQQQLKTYANWPRSPHHEGMCKALLLWQLNAKHREHYDLVEHLPGKQETTSKVTTCAGIE